MKGLEWSQDFQHHNPMEAICCHGNQSSYLIWPKNECILFPHPMMLQMKFDFNWPADLSESVDARMEAQVPSYELTELALGSGQLKI